MALDKEKIKEELKDFTEDAAEEFALGQLEKASKAKDAVCGA